MEELKTPSARWQINRHDVDKIAKAFFYSVVSAALASIIMMMKSIEIPVEWAFMIPMINTVIVAGKKWSDGKVAQEGISGSDQTEYQ